MDIGFQSKFENPSFQLSHLQKMISFLFQITSDILEKRAQ